MDDGGEENIIDLIFGSLPIVDIDTITIELHKKAKQLDEQEVTGNME